MSKRGQYVELYKTISILGYSLLPFTLLAGLSIFTLLKESIFGWIAAALMMAWSTTTATRYFEHGLDM